MPLNTMRDLLITQLNELYASEQHNRQILPRLAEAAANPKLAAALRSHGAETGSHLERLEEVLGDLGVRPRPSGAESKGMKGLCQDCLSLAKMSNAEPHVRDAALIAVAQHVEHDEIAGYGCARTWARLLGHTKAADRLQTTLDEEKAADARLSALAESLNRAALEPAAV
jgi:ferritin-like metal-binding protein YciE